MKCLALLGLCCVLIACASAPPPPRTPAVQPVALGPEGSETISFTKVILRIPAGTDIGAIFVKHSKKGSVPLIMKTNVELGTEEFRLSAIDELQRFGYSVLGAEDILFERSVKYKPRFLLGGVITDLQLDRYTQKAGSANSSTVTVQWQLFDTQQEKTVYQKTTTASARKEKDESVSSAFLAFSRALDELLADKQFVALVSKKVGLAAGEGSVKSQALISVAACIDRPFSLPEDLQLVEQAVVVVRARELIGAGVVISKDGLVLTAGHVVRGTKTALLEFKSGLTMEAEVLRVSDTADLALLKLAGNGHKCLPLRNEASGLVGQEVYAIGTPRGLEFSVTKGVLSEIRGEGLEQVLQTDASISPGNSGGPILDRTGHVLGIVSWKRVDRGTEGLAFAVPVAVIEEALKLSLN